MGESNGVHLASHQWELIRQMVKDEMAESRSEAVSRAVNIGLSELGYTHGGGRGSLARAGDLVGLATGSVALAWLGVTMVYQINLVLPAVAALLASLTAFGVSRVAGGFEVGDALGDVLGGGRA